MKIVLKIELFVFLFMFFASGCVGPGGAMVTGDGLSKIGNALGSYASYKIESSKFTIGKDTQDDVERIKGSPAEDKISFLDGRMQILEYFNYDDGHFVLYCFTYNQTHKKLLLREINRVEKSKTYLRLKTENKNAFEDHVKQMFSKIYDEVMKESSQTAITQATSTVSEAQSPITTTSNQ